jgi:crotonobetainyl-CoA:carnitine CoA-transferase CaiB-like acyl-CoA transferase
MAKLGLDFDSLKSRNPALVMISGSVYGQTGPLAPEWGVDGTGGALSSRTFMSGWPDRDPIVPGSVPYGDVILPFVMAAAGLAALADGRQTGTGAHIDASMYEVCVQQMRDAILEAQTGAAPERRGNADPSVFHQEVYPAAGDDRWVAVTCTTENEFEKLCEVAGGRDIAQWVAARVDHEVAELLQESGIAAAAVQDIEDLFEKDPSIRERGALVELEHPLLGNFGHMRTPITFASAVLRPFRAPSIGEHSVKIAKEIAGLSGQAITALDAEGVFK